LIISWIRSPIFLAAFAAVGFAVVPASADTCSPNSSIIAVGDLAEGTQSPNSGNFGCDSDEEVITFSIDTPATQVDLFTTSWTTGGFAPILTLFDSTGAELTYDAGGEAPNACGARGTSPGGTLYDRTQTCLDAYINTTLAIGTYTLVLTEQDNLATNGSFLSDGGGFDKNYSNYGALSFTGEEWTPSTNPTATFLSPNNGDPLSSAWTVDLVNPAPEPVTVFMALSGLLLTWASVRRRRRRTGF